LAGAHGDLVMAQVSTVENKAKTDRFHDMAERFFENQCWTRQKSPKLRKLR
jgi:hypothetical protein